MGEGSGSSGGPPSWDVDVFQISDLPPEERRVLEPGRAPSAIPAPALGTLSVHSSHFVPAQTYASISWESGKEIRIYHPGPGNILQEFAYSESKDRNSVYHGSLHTLGIVVDPNSSIAAMRREDGTTCLYYQEPTTDFIRMVSHSDSTKVWTDCPRIAKAAKNSSFAVVKCPNTKLVSRIYYQDPELHLRERHYDRFWDGWTLGHFDAGVQPRGTPITAEVVHGGDVGINVIWRDALGRVASASWSKSSGWDVPNSDGGLHAPVPDGRD